MAANCPKEKVQALYSYLKNTVQSDRIVEDQEHVNAFVRKTVGEAGEGLLPEILELVLLDDEYSQTVAALDAHLNASNGDTSIGPVGAPETSTNASWCGRRR